MAPPANPAGKLLLELAGGIALYYGVFVVGPALQDSTSELRLRISELRDRGRDVWRAMLEIQRFRSEIDRWGKVE